ncbi:MAG: hypothetical protein CL910_19915 [Deltaproteobacteria bacterium]|jgi:hypothetical protein|nr:hypothetical protein [Deltaproteobacteria bacterium]
MPSIQETIPDHLAEAAEAARAWFSADQGSEFKLTGIVDPAESFDGPLQLILCGTQAGQEVCLRERFDIRRAASGFDVAHIEEAPPEFGSVAPRLDPPPGERAGWIDDVIARHDFTVVLFYRGFW